MWQRVLNWAVSVDVFTHEKDCSHEEKSYELSLHRHIKTNKQTNKSFQNTKKETDKVFCLLRKPTLMQRKIYLSPRKLERSFVLSIRGHRMMMRVHWNSSCVYTSVNYPTYMWYLRFTYKTGDCNIPHAPNAGAWFTHTLCFARSMAPRYEILTKECHVHVCVCFTEKCTRLYLKTFYMSVVQKRYKRMSFHHYNYVTLL